MKRILAVLMTLAMLLPLFSCGGGTSLVEGGTETKETAATAADTAEADAGPHEVSGFSAGFARADITPETSVPLAGYGNVENRMSTNVLDPLYATAIALQDESGEKLVIIQLDIINTSKGICDPIRKMILKESGIDEDHILINATHTHSGPSTGTSNPGVTRWQTKMIRATAQAVKDALADLDACTGLSVGATETEGMNFVRRYYTENGFVSPNVTIGTGKITAHETEVDKEMRIVKFDRKNQPAIIIANWQAHNHKTGGEAKTDISSDFVGVFQKKAEEQLGVKVLYLQGGAGNINPYSRISGEALYGDYKDFAQALVDHMVDGLGHMTSTPLGKIRTASGTIEAVVDKPVGEDLNLCKRVYDLYNNNNKPAAEALAKQNGLTGYIEAISSYRNAQKEDTEEVTLRCYAIGDVAITAAPFEMFCQTEKALREASPFDYTVTRGLPNTSHGYMPAAECFPNKGYEVFQCHYVQGTAEQINEKQLEMLNELKAK